MPELPSRIDMCIHTGCRISQPRGIVPRCRGAGFILWEIMFALTIFLYRWDRANKRSPSGD